VIAAVAHGHRVQAEHPAIGVDEDAIERIAVERQCLATGALEGEVVEVDLDRAGGQRDRRAGEVGEVDGVTVSGRRNGGAQAARAVVIAVHHLEHRCRSGARRVPVRHRHLREEPVGGVLAQADPVGVRTRRRRR